MARKTIKKIESEFIKAAHEAGAEFVAEYISWHGNIEDFDGQSEAQDIAKANGLDADYVYEGMMIALRSQGFQV